MNNRNEKAIEMKMYYFVLVLVLFLGACQKETSTLALDSSWADRTLQEKGLGAYHPEKSLNDTLDRLESYREAKADLYSKLESDIMSLKIDAKRDVKTYIGDNKKLKEKVVLFLKGTRITDAVYVPQKGMELSGELYLGGSFKSILGLNEKKAPEEKPNTHTYTNSSPGSGY
ncbi:MAG: hypothetical protein HYR80_09480 [Nitrospirae bacterium]|nr:hypothetical protein [Nitrospirota bacterium]